MTGPTHTDDVLERHARAIANHASIWLQQEYAEHQREGKDIFRRHLLEVEHSSGEGFYFLASATPGTRSLSRFDWDQIAKRTRRHIEKRSFHIYGVEPAEIYFNSIRNRLEISFV